MTVEHKLVVGLEDIKGIVFECRNQERHCSSRVHVSPDESRIPTRCPSCGVEWLPLDKLAEIKTTSSTWLNFVQAIGTLRAREVAPSVEAVRPKFRILLEFDDPARSTPVKPPL